MSTRTITLDTAVGHTLTRLRDAGDELILSAPEARWRWSRGYVPNVAAAIVTALTDSVATGRTYNVGEPDALPQITWLRRLAEVAGLGTTVRTGPPEEQSDAPPFHWTYDLALGTTDSAPNSGLPNRFRTSRHSSRRCCGSGRSRAYSVLRIPFAYCVFRILPSLT